MPDKINQNGVGTVKRAWYETAIDFIKEIDIPGKKLVGAAIDKFRAKVLTWYKDYSALVADKTKLPKELDAERKSLIESGKKIIWAIEKLGIDLNQESIERNLGAIFIPIIAGGAAAAVLTMIGVYYYNDREHKRNVKIYFDARKAGASATEASKVVKAVKPGGVFEGLGDTTVKISRNLVIGAVVVGGLYLYFNRRV